MIKGKIIIPTNYEPFWNKQRTISANAPLVHTISEYFNFELEYSNKITINNDTNILFLFSTPNVKMPYLPEGLVDIPKDIKLILWPGDLHCEKDSLCYRNRIKIFERADLIVSPVYSLFKERHSGFLEKCKFMPKFYCYGDFVEINTNPIMKVLLTGTVSKKYPLRALAVQHSNVVRKKKKIYGDDYINLLRQFYCGISSSSIYNYAVSKYMEIPSTGSLLIANQIEDSDKAGFVPNKHYVPINKDNLFDVIDDCISYPNKYKRIRLRGMRFVQMYHSLQSRIKSLENIFDELLNNKPLSSFI